MDKRIRQTQQQKNTSARATAVVIHRRGGNGSKLPHDKRTEKELRESEEKYRNLFEYAKDAIILADTETGIISDVNTAACNLLGLPKEKIIGKHQSEIHPPELVESYKKLFQDHIKKGIVIDEDIVVQKADGTRVPIDISASVINIGDKKVIQGIFRDVSERLRIAKALQESEEKLSKAFQAIPEAISIATLKEGVFLEVNDSFLTLNGYSRKEVIGHRSKELGIWVNPKDRYRIKQLMEKSGHFENEEFILRRKSGKRRTVLLSAETIKYGGVPCILTIGTDITDRKRMEKTLVDEGTRRRILIEQSSDGIVILDINGKVYDANQKFADMLEYSLKEVRKLHVFDWEFLYPKEQVVEMIRTVDEKGDHFETQHRRKDGTTFDVEISTNGAMFAGQKLIFCVCRDITKRKKMEQALSESEEKFSKAFNASPQQIIITRDRDDVTIDVNDSFTRITGFTREETIGKTSKELGVWEDSKDNERLQQTLKKHGRIENEEFEFIMKSGEKHNSLVSIEPIVIGGEKCWISVATDITQFKKIESAVRQSEENISKAFKAIPEAISITSKKDGAFIEVNDSFINLTGFTREEVIGRQTQELDVWADSADYDRIRKMLDKSGHFENEEFLLKRKSGEIRSVLISAESINFGDKPCMMVVRNDITKRKEMEKALRESEESIAKAFHAIPEAISIATLKDGVFLEANESFLTLNGYSRKEVIGHQSKELDIWVNPEDRYRMKQLMDNYGRFENEEFLFRKKSGEIRTVLLSADTINYGGKPCMLTIGTDITDRKKEENLQHAENHILTLLGQGAELEEVLEAIVLLCEENDPSIKGSYMLYDPSRDLLSGYGPSLSKEYNAAMKAGIPIGPIAGCCGTAAYRKQRIVIKDIAHSPLFKPYKEAIDLATRNGLFAVWSEPIISSKGEVLGTIANYNDHTGGPNADNIRTLEWAGKIAAIAVERKKIERELKESEEKFSKAFHAMPEGVSIARIRDGVFIDVNESFCRDNNYTREEVIGFRGEELNLAISPSQRDEVIRTLKKTGHFENLEFGIKKKTGEPITLLLSAEMINIGGEPCLLTISSNITERKKIEQALKESEEKYRLLSENMPVTVFSTLPDEKLTSVFVSGMAKELTGYTADEMMKNPELWSSLLYPEDKATVWQRILDHRNKKEMLDLEYRIITKEGKVKWIRAKATPALDKNGEIATIDGFMEDITERKKMEMALKESEEKFSIAFHSMPESVTISRLDDGTFIDVNESFCHETGNTREEIIGKTGHWVDQEQRKQMIKLIKKQGRIVNMECEFRKKSGELHTLLMSADIINIKGEKCMLAIGNDITQRKRMEQALRESEEKFSKAFHAMPDEVSLSRIKDGVFLDANESFCRNNGYTRDEVIGHSSRELNLSMEPGKLAQFVKTVREQGHIENIECELKQKTGEKRTVLMSAVTLNIAGEPCILSITGDITERNRMEQALRESEEKFSKAFHAMPETISISTATDGKFIDVNESFLKLYKLTREEVIGRTGDQIHFLKPRDKRNKIRELVQKTKRFKNVEIEFKAKSGKMLTFLYSADTIEINGEKCLMIIGNDITKRKQAEIELQQALVDLEQSSAMLRATNKELESFSYSVSHDLRSPLRSIDGFSQALLEDYTEALDEKGQDYLNRLRNASQRMGELIDGLLKLSRLTRSEMHLEKVDLTSLANEIATRLKETHDKRNVKFNIEKDLTANGDPEMLRVLLENLIGNAWKFTKNKEKALIEFGGTTDDGERKTFFVKDNGAGFDMAFKDKLFGAFQRLHDAGEYPGTGIGLATVQRIINRHGGGIRAEGETGKGATFYFTLN